MDLVWAVESINLTMVSGNHNKIRSDKALMVIFRPSNKLSIGYLDPEYGDTDTRLYSDMEYGDIDQASLTFPF